MKVSRFTTKKNNYSKRYLEKEYREEYLVAKLSKKSSTLAYDFNSPTENTINNWERTSNGAKIWSF